MDAEHVASASHRLLFGVEQMQPDELVLAPHAANDGGDVLQAASVSGSISSPTMKMRSESSSVSAGAGSGGGFVLLLRRLRHQGYLPRHVVGRASGKRPCEREHRRHGSARRSAGQLY